MNVNMLFDEIKKLSPYSQKQLFELIYPIVNKSSNNVGDYLNEIREVRFSKGTHCPHCKSNNIIGYGKYRSRQRYKCKDCGKTFNDTSCSPMAGTHMPEKWAMHIQMIAEKYTLRQIAKALDISLSTAFYWRHKVIKALQNLDLETLTGIVESDETFILESQKGCKNIKGRSPRKRGGKSKFRGISKEQVCILVAMDRNGHIISQKAGMGRISAKKIDAVFGNHIATDATLCSDSARNYIYYAKSKGLAHEKVNIRQKKYVVNKIYHIQHVNSYHGRVKDWITLGMRGVATKYMDNYLAWHRFIELCKAMDKVQIKKTLLTQMFSTNTSTLVKQIRPSQVV